MDRTYYDNVKEELEDLAKQGDTLLTSLAYYNDMYDDDTKKRIREQKVKLVSVEDNYQAWYTQASSVIKQIIPHRLEDFCVFYSDRKLKKRDINYETYTMQDYMQGLEVSRFGKTIIGPKAAYNKLKIQVDILKSALKHLDSALLDIRELVKADLFDGELLTARELNNKGFFRAAGAVAGVVLEKHLKDVCDDHGLKSRKQKPCMADYNELLKSNNIIEIPTWRKVQYLADIRNKCDHPGDEPTKDEISDLIEGVNKIIKTVY